MNNLIESTVAIVLTVVLLMLYYRIRLKKLKGYKSPLLGKIEVFQKYSGENILTTNGFAQGISTDQKDIDQSYWYRVAQEVVKSCQNKKSPRVLFLGLGANTSSSLIGRMDPKINQTIIEWDPLIVQANKDFFELDKLPNYEVKIANVFSLIKNPKAFKNLFDVIILDVFKGEQPFISEDTNHSAFIDKTLRWLKKDGMLLFNRPAHNKEMKKRAEKLQEYLEKKFNRTKFFDIKDPRGYRNYVICASNPI